MLLQMLQVFFMSSSTDNCQRFFERSLIGKNELIIRSHFRQHPVLVLNFQFCACKTWQLMREEIYVTLIQMGLPYEDALHEHTLSPNQPMPLNRGSHSQLKDKSDLAMVSSIEGWTRCLYEIFGKRVIVLVDDFDTPLHYAFRYGFQSTAYEFFRALYTCAFKGNRYLEKACVFGNFEPTESIFSNFDNVKICSVSVDDYSRHFGFTDAEALACLDKNQALLAMVKKWYGGFHVGSHNLINPFSFMYWLDRREFKSFWIEKIDTFPMKSVLEPFIKNIFFDAVSLLFSNCSTICFTLPRNQHIVSSADAPKKISASVFNLLVHAGYLTYYGSAGQGVVRIPNDELRGHWQNYIVGLMENFLYKGNVLFKFKLQDALTNPRVTLEDVDSVIRKLFTLFLFHFDVHQGNENLYFRFFFGCFSMAVHDASDVIVQSFTNICSGRFDICIELRDVKWALIFEFRRSSPQSDVTEISNDELLQIYKNYYARSLKGFNCVLIGVLFNENTTSCVNLYPVIDKNRRGL